MIVEPVVNGEKLRELVALETEYPTLDFKGYCDLNETRDRVEIAKDIGAMSVMGGYLVIGADSKGKATEQMTPKLAELFDEARLRPMMLKWLPDSLEVHAQGHEIGGHTVVLVYITPNPAGCAFFRANGEYQDPKKGLVTVFTEGDVFFRDGTQSKRLNQRGLEDVIARRVEGARRQWEDDHASEYRRLAEQLRTGTAGQQIAKGSANELNFNLEPDVLGAAAIELLRTNDEIPLRLLLSRALPTARELFHQGDEDGLARFLDRLTCLAAQLLVVERLDWFERTIDALVAIYGLPYEGQPGLPDYPPPEVAALWLTVIERVIGLGALAVRINNWQAVRVLATRREPHAHPLYPSWIRHALTMATRAGLLETYEGTQQIKLSLLSLAREVVRRLECLRPDVAVDDERILDTLAQFDFLACLAPMTTREDAESERGFYTNFARFRSTRTNPIVDRLISDEQMRRILTSLDDADLARALVSIGKMARSEGLRYDGWYAYDPEVAEFIEDQTE